MEEQPIHQALFGLILTIASRLPTYIDPLHINGVGLMFLLHIREHEGCKVSELAHALRMDKASVTRGLAPLGKLGYVEKQRAKLDTRTFNLYLTPAGRLVLRGIEEILHDWDRGAALALGDRGYSSLCSELARLCEQMAAQAAKDRAVSLSSHFTTFIA